MRCGKCGLPCGRGLFDLGISRAPKGVRLDTTSEWRAAFRPMAEVPKSLGSAN